MNLQTTKPRARLVAQADGDLPELWRITHPESYTAILTCRPHDGAVALLREFVLPRMIEGGKS